ncbi:MULTISPECIES: DUF808 domain-containing protein [Aeromonas]|uniref:DUF808 domain-containing protein n=2 Tax=Aeromonas salmonicida subsp. salmonicida TaxID=29491 RepID=A4SNZ2_AERS4|nr:MULTISPECIES: DUF808 domain-containing protein [Aeromonas]MBP6167078.1 DUF808 domain-containing protein [Aeromonas sp.]ABO90614.1 conserved hypothetical protein [Aeromonas salmonicida subsp. salmonicida A449]ASI29721.1 hypothetical protein CE463_10790 [Aeromonas salmonicida]ASI33855.1 hypothetical protein CE462_09685 [Aeromonas salmonicida]ATD40495.1 hypothetical protein BHG40_17050 [Aeromonas salmonicida subsp. masoucida]
MAGTSLLALLDDIASVLDDVALMTKVAAKKTAGVLGDDLALNAEQVSGVRAERELPVVWAVAKGSFRNKLILVPAAIAISALVPWLITPLLMLGGAYLCFEGAEKLAHKLLPHDAAEGEPSSQVVPDDLVAFEQQKVKGAIRTDFILSAEIIVIALGTVQGSSLGLQISVVAGIALLMTVGVYGLVGLIVKLDDIGLHLLQKSDGSALRRAVGQGLLVTAPRLMHLLALVGTIAMFMVGGGILVHGWPFAHHLIEGAAGALATLPTVGTVLAAITPTLLNAVAGVVAGLLLVLAMTLVSKLKPAR